MKTRSLLIIGIVGIILLSSLGFVLNSDDKINENKIRIAYFPNIGHAIPIVGIEQGFFEKSLGNDVQIETRVFDSGPQVIESLFANSVDLAYVGPGPAITGFLNSENHNVKILAGAFAGKKIAAPQIGNTQDVSLRNYLSEHGLKSADKGGSVIIYNIPNPDIYTLFVKGDIDGAWVAEPWATILETELGGKRLFHEEEFWPNKEFASVLLIGNVDYVEKHPQVISNFLMSHHETAIWINQNPVDTRIVFNDFLKSYLGKSISDDVVDVALSNIVITDDPKSDSVYSFAKKADALGYLGRNGYDLTGIFYSFDSNPSLEAGN
jgi:NitT/TauT family transport system substrate-binding protein